MFYYDKILSCLNEISYDTTIWYTPKLINNKLNKAGFLPTKIRFTVDETAELNGNEYKVGAEYDDEDDLENRPSICLHWYFSPYITNTDFMDMSDWEKLKVDIADILEHEMKHLESARKRDFVGDSRILVDTTELLEYLSDEDEIEAYALNAAREISRKFGPNRSKRAFDYLIHSDGFDTNETPTLLIYKDTCNQFPIIKRKFYGWVYYYLKQIYQV